MQVMQVYDFTMAPGGFAQIPVAGAYYRIVNATGPVAIKEDAGSTCGPLLPGQGMRNRKFSALTITDKSGLPNVGQLIVAGSDFIDDRINGEVQMMKAIKARKGASFMTAGYATGDGASYAQAQLWNPQGSGKVVYVTGMKVDANGQIVIAKTTNAVIAGTQMQARSKVAGGSVGAAVVVASLGAQTQMNAASHIGLGMSWQLDDAIVLPAGFGLVVGTTDPAAFLCATFEHIEEQA